jgi:hypothetical protein
LKVKDFLLEDSALPPVLAALLFIVNNPFFHQNFRDQTIKSLLDIRPIDGAALKQQSMTLPVLALNLIPHLRIQSLFLLFLFLLFPFLLLLPCFLFSLLFFLFLQIFSFPFLFLGRVQRLPIFLGLLLSNLPLGIPFFLMFSIQIIRGVRG